ncbi:uncharacterized protein BXZ73DRAFT_97180 [Epithele typhae]|uniref:uncharacterized protein n=1 Tax=Epithele typhae TaxID=378194 RepID=UPI0020075706|nr:uncharacterized protein BXZ73DRAFT_97180 [Epithele typhae]KAH9943126.1 hypothetical protein BXZ73DRAFT_97180 [Epithele typhae]
MSAGTPEKPARKHRKSKSTDVQDLAETLVPSEKPKKSKKSKRSEPEDLAPVEDSAPSSPKEKKLKKLKHALEVDGTELQDDGMAKKKRKHKHTEAEAEAGLGGVQSSDADVVSQDQIVKSKKSRKPREGTDEKAEEGSVNKSKRERKKHSKGEDEEEAPVMSSTSSVTKKKKRKHRSSANSYPDPAEDEVLTEQAQKALQYAFSQFNDPTSWKFNKARQNWLIRNIWLAEAIPEQYLPLTIQYLQGVQGGVRETLLKACRDAMEAQKAEKTEIPSTANTAETQTDSASPSKQTVKFAAEPEPIAEPSPTDTTKRERAATLLEALTSAAS